MKILIILIAAGLLLYSCSDKKAQKKKVLDSVLAIHDKVMGTEEKLQKNKMLLDTVIDKGHLTAKDTAFTLRAKLMLADSVMDNWMHDFDYEQKGKSDDETMIYMSAQKKKIMAIEAQLSAAVDQSNQYLSKTKK